MVFWILGILGIVLIATSLVLDDVISGLDFGPEWLSGTAIGAGLGAFGLIGGLVASGSGSPVTASAAGLAGGGTLAFAAGWFTRSLKRGEGGAVFSQDSYLGAQGTVVTAIKSGSSGEVNIPVNGHPVKVNARADQALDVGTAIEVTQALSATLVRVRPLTEKRTPPNP